MAQAQESRSQLWKRYFEESQSQLQALDGALEALGQEPWELGHLTAAQGVFHNFAGSGTLYAAPKVSALGGEGEYMCASIAMKGQAMREEELQQIEGLARRIRAEFQRLLNASTSAAAAQSKTTSGVPLLFMVAPPSADIAALTDYLTKRRIQVQVFSTLREAEKRLDIQMPDLAVVWVRLEDGSGYDFVRGLRSRESVLSIPVLLLGESRHFLDKVEAIHCGADGFVPDPPDPATVMKKLKTLLAKRRASAARILIVEDDPSQARFLEDFLATAGYVVKICKNPTQFETELYAFHPHIVLMDILLPGMSGYDLVRFMRQEEGFSAIPAIFITTEGQRHSQVMAAEAGGDDFLVKPVSSQDLLIMVKSRLARYRTLQDLMDHDEMTGLLAHTPFLKEAHLCLTRHSRRQAPYAMVLVQLDTAAAYNEDVAAKARDVVLQELAKFLQRKIRQTDVMGRYGEQQLGLVLEHLTAEDALLLMRRVQQEFATIEHSVGQGRILRGTFSTGIAMVGPDIKTLKVWLERASSALHLSLTRGGNQTSLYEAKD